MSVLELLEVGSGNCSRARLGCREAASSAKLVAPPLPRHWIRRDRLGRQLSGAPEHRLRLLTPRSFMERLVRQAGLRWRGRIDFLWAVPVDRMADGAGVLDHCRAVGELIGRTREPGSLQDHAVEPAWLPGIDAPIAAHLPILAARGHVRLGRSDQAQAILIDHLGSAERAQGQRSPPSWPWSLVLKIDDRRLTGWQPRCCSTRKTSTPAPISPSTPDWCWPRCSSSTMSSGPLRNNAWLPSAWAAARKGPTRAGRWRSRSSGCSRPNNVSARRSVALAAPRGRGRGEEQRKNGAASQRFDGLHRWTRRVQDAPDLPAPR